MNPTSRFSDRAGAYSLHRPTYPRGVFDVLLDGLGDPSRLRVADIGAGTGISSAALAERVAHVLAVEPNAQMRERAAQLANVTWYDGTAEQTGLTARSVDLAAAFQAFHWFDPERAFDEFSRIARRRAGIIQYERDESSPFSAAYGALVRLHATDDTEGLRERALRHFERLAGTRLRRAEVRFVQTLSLEGVLGRIASSSYLPQTGASAGALRAQASSLFERLADRGTVEMAMIAFVLTVDFESEAGLSRAPGV